MINIRIIPKGKETLEEMEKRIYLNLYLYWLAENMPQELGRYGISPQLIYLTDPDVYFFKDIGNGFLTFEITA